MRIFFNLAHGLFLPALTVPTTALQNSRPYIIKFDFKWQTLCHINGENKKMVKDLVLVRLYYIKIKYFKSYNYSLNKTNYK